MNYLFVIGALVSLWVIIVLLVPPSTLMHILFQVLAFPLECAAAFSAFSYYCLLRIRTATMAKRIAGSIGAPWSSVDANIWMWVRAEIHKVGMHGPLVKWVFWQKLGVSEYLYILRGVDEFDATKAQEEVAP